MAKTKRKFYPNVHRKRLFSYTLDTWVRFQVTSTALREIDTVGGIDNYLMNLDDKSIARSNYVNKMHRIISISLFHQGKLTNKQIKKFKFDTDPPPPLNYGDMTVFTPSTYSTPYGDRIVGDRVQRLPVGIQSVKMMRDSLESSTNQTSKLSMPLSSHSIEASSSSSSSSPPSSSSTTKTSQSSIGSTDGIDINGDSAAQNVRENIDIVISPYAQPDTPFVEDLDLQGEVIIIRNPSQSTEFDMGGWQVSDQHDKHKWKIPEGTLLPPQSSMHIYCNAKEVDMHNLSEHHYFWTNKVHCYHNHSLSVMCLFHLCD